MFKIRQRNLLLIAIVIVLTPCILIIIRMGPVLSSQETLSQRLAECHVRLQYLEGLYRRRQEDVILLTQYLSLQLQHQQQQQQRNTNNIVWNLSNSYELSTTIVPTSQSRSELNMPKQPSLLNDLSPETRKLITNITTSQKQFSMDNHTSSYLTGNSYFRLPSVYNFLPHLLDSPESLRPAYLISKSRSDVSIVLGVPTVKREKQTYVLRTIQNLIENMDEAEQNDTLIVLYIGETNIEDVLAIEKEIRNAFEVYVANGLIDIIAPDATYFPDFNKIRITLNDSLERVKWRSKQNLDFAYIMSYAQTKGTFYVQLEDDIMAKPNFITTMKKYAFIKSAPVKADQTPWLLLDFCQLGFIGKMFRSVDLPYLVTFFQMFYNEMPVDWLLIHYIESKVCRIDQDAKHCLAEKSKYWLHHKPSLFQHIGTSSSLKGKVQKLKDKQFGVQLPIFYGHTNNPPAIIKSTISSYKNFQIQRAYNGETYFWGLLPQRGDSVRFVFEKPTRLRHFLFRSGNSEHPSDRFYNTTIEILPTDSLKSLHLVYILSSLYNVTSDGFLIVGSFDSMGVGEGSIDNRINTVREVRLFVHGDTENWVLLSEIQLLTDETLQLTKNKTDKLVENIGVISALGGS